MKMSYLLKTNRHRSSRLKIIILVLFLAVLVFLGAGLRSFFSPLTQAIINPIFKVAQKLKISSQNWFAFLEPKKILIAQNEKLKMELLTKGQILLDYQTIKSENEILKGIASRNATSTRVIAGVLRTPDQSPYDTIIIDAGADQAVVKGNLVYAKQEIPIGAIEFVYQNSALVKLYSTPGETHDVYLGYDKIAGRAVGRGGGNFEVILPHGAKVFKGDAVTLPGLTGKIFGEVESLAETEGGTFIRALFKNPFSFDELRFVEVLVK
ncbi:MAG: rod shape-determining protein MreC [bacterium]|nr:rod shape-determining protein MreC [bacterium]